VSRTITGTTTTGIVLSSTFDNPVTVANGALVESDASQSGDFALVGGSVKGLPDYNFPWSITNLGAVEGKDATSSGIVLYGGGTITNYSYISGGRQGIFTYNQPATVINKGLILGFGTYGVGIILTAGGQVTNDDSILGDGLNGIKIGGANATVANYGVINPGTHFVRAGVDLYGSVSNLLINGSGGVIQNGVEVSFHPASVINQGTIPSKLYGIFLQGSDNTVVNASTIVNTGTIDASFSGVMIEFGSDAYPTDIVTNGSVGAKSALITGGNYGIEAYIELHTAATIGQPVAVTNFGTISAVGIAGVGIDFGIGVGGGAADNTVSNSGTIGGAGGTAVAFGAGDDKLIVNPGAVFDGIVDGGGGGNEIDFHIGGKIGLAPEFIGFATVRLIAADSLTLTPSDLAGLAGNTITVLDGNAGDTVSAAALVAAEQATVTGGTGNDTFTGGAGKDVFSGGDGADTFRFSIVALTTRDRVTGDAGNDELLMTKAGTVAASGVSSVETYKLANGGANILSLTKSNFAGVTDAAITVIGGDDGNIVSAVTLAATDQTTVVGGGGNDFMIGGAGKDVFAGNAGSDTFEFAVAALTASDVVKGGSGGDTLFLTSAGTVAAGGVGGVETWRLANGGANKLTLTTSNFAGVTAVTITVEGGNAGNTVDAHLAGAGDHAVMIGGAGKDLFTGGAGADTFRFSVATLSAGDIVKGGGGNDTLFLTSAGKIVAAGVSGVETWRLASGGADTLTLTNGNFAGVTGATITVEGGADGNTLSAAGGSASDLAVLVGGAGKDILTAGQHAKLTGGGGADQFVFATPGSTASPDANTITDFIHATDKIVFRDAGFNLGSDDGKGTATLQAIAKSLFSPDTNGSFATTANRFAYNTKTGVLFYDADGSGKAHASQRIATLTNHPTLTATDLFFIR
jgi:Ca2+-binding RTX toxin-like protein